MLRLGDCQEWLTRYNDNIAIYSSNRLYEGVLEKIIIFKKLTLDCNTVCLLSVIETKSDSFYLVCWQSIYLKNGKYREFRTELFNKTLNKIKRIIILLTIIIFNESLLVSTSLGTQVVVMLSVQVFSIFEPVLRQTFSCLADQTCFF